jgi:hypothetical protein
MRTILIVITVVSGLATHAGGADDTPRPSREPRSHIQAVGEVASQSAAPWAGLTTARAPAVLRQQLSLEHGAGLIVEEVSPGSAAEKAGLKQHDVLVSLDEQLLVLPEQLVTLLEEWGDDAPLECRVVRGGKSTKVFLRPRRPLSAERKLAADTNQREASKAKSSGKLKPAASVMALLSRPPAVPASSAPVAAPAASSQSSSMLLNGTVVQLEDGSLLQRDADYSIKLSTGPDATLVVKDARGRIVFNGPIATPEQRSFVPTGAIARVEGLEQLQTRRQALVERVVTEQSPNEARPERIGTLGIKPVELR